MKKEVKIKFYKKDQTDLDFLCQGLSNGSLGMVATLLVRWQISFSCTYFYLGSNPAVLRMVGRTSGGHYRLQTRHSVGIESASDFDSAGEIAVKSRMTFNLKAVSCRTLCLGHKLIDYVFLWRCHPHRPRRSR